MLNVVQQRLQLLGTYRFAKEMRWEGCHVDVGGQTDRQMDGWTYRQTDRQMDGWTYR